VLCMPMSITDSRGSCPRRGSAIGNRSRDFLASP
jgi:hypothetical protein